MLLKWNMQRGVVVLAKASSPQHMSDNLVNMFDWKLTNDQKASLDALEAGERCVLRGLGVTRGLGRGRSPWDDWLEMTSLLGCVVKGFEPPFFPECLHKSSPPHHHPQLKKPNP